MRDWGRSRRRGLTDRGAGWNAPFPRQDPDVVQAQFALA